MIELSKPNDFRFSNPDNVLNQLDANFEDVCSAMQEAGMIDPKKLSTFEFYSKIEYFENKKRKLPNRS